jgi:hypothetical protein
MNCCIELLHRVSQLTAIIPVFQRLIGRESQRDICQAPPALMLHQEHIDEIGKLVRFLEARKEEVFFELLVVILDKIANYFRGLCNRLWRQLFIRIHATERFTVNEQNALQHSMLPHQILRRRDFVFFFSSSFVNRFPADATNDDAMTMPPALMNFLRPEQSIEFILLRARELSVRSIIAAVKILYYWIRG